MYTAYVVHRESVYRVHGDYGKLAPESSVVNLIQGVYEHSPKLAREILRNRIYTNQPLSEMCLGMIKIAAKRYTLISKSLSHLSGIDVSNYSNQSEVHFSETLPVSISHVNNMSDWANIAEKVLGKIQTSPLDIKTPLFHRDRNVVALLLSSDNQFLGWSKNTNAQNRTRHAEVNLIQGWWKKHHVPLPNGAKIITTLQTCKMCAGMFWECMDKPASLRAFYLEKDLGPSTRNRIWDRLAPTIEMQIK